MSESAPTPATPPSAGQTSAGQTSAGQTSATQVGEYEFTNEQNKIFAELADNLSFAGWFILIVVISFHVVIFGNWGLRSVAPYEKFRLVNVLWPFLAIVCCVQFISTANAFRKVVDTKGSDISHLMEGLSTLNSAFSWLTIVPRVWVILACISLLVGLILAIVHLFGY